MWGILQFVNKPVANVGHRKEKMEYPLTLI